MGISVRAYARHRGQSHTAVQKALKVGRIVALADGTIDPVAADAAWVLTTDQAQQRPPAAPKPAPRTRPPVVKPVLAAALKPVATVAVKSARASLQEEGVPVASGALTFVEARTAHEIAKAHVTRLRLQKMRGELVDRAKATALVFRLAREERDAWITWPARVSALMAAELGVGAHAMQQALEKYARANLAELAGIKAEFR